MTSNIELLPCPFCSSPPLWAASFAADDFEIQCSSQACPVMIICGGRNEAECAAKWNLRPAIAGWVFLACFRWVVIVGGLLFWYHITFGAWRP